MRGRAHRAWGILFFYLVGLRHEARGNRKQAGTATGLCDARDALSGLFFATGWFSPPVRIDCCSYGA